MGRLKGGASNETEVKRLSLDELNALITHADWRFHHAGLNSAMRKDAFERLMWLERWRELLHRVPAPQRQGPRRGQVSE